jgi:hypothetical protein
MATLLRDTPCNVCGKQHHFTLPQGEFSQDGHYEFLCPETGTKAEFRAPAHAENVTYPPQGAVQLTPRRGR